MADGRQAILRRKIRDPLALSIEHRLGEHDKCLRSTIGSGRLMAVKPPLISAGARAVTRCSANETPTALSVSPPIDRVGRIGWVHQDRHREILGTTSRSISTGVVAALMTIGMVVVAGFAASAGCVGGIKITSTFSLTSSAASSPCAAGWQ